MTKEKAKKSGLARVISLNPSGRNNRNEPTFKAIVEIEITRLDHSLMGFHQEIASGKYGERDISYSSTCGLGVPAIGITMKREKPKKDRVFKESIHIGFGLMPVLKALTEKLDDMDEPEEIKPPQKGAA